MYRASRTFELTSSGQLREHGQLFRTFVVLDVWRQFNHGIGVAARNEAVNLAKPGLGTTGRDKTPPPRDPMVQPDHMEQGSLPSPLCNSRDMPKTTELIHLRKVKIRFCLIDAMTTACAGRTSLGVPRVIGPREKEMGVPQDLKVGFATYLLPEGQQDTSAVPISLIMVHFPTIAWVKESNNGQPFGAAWQQGRLPHFSISDSSQPILLEYVPPP
ncbi:hypothetical protein M426DRAFT_262281 [Hypoxylon sp. CI-4A]|nr:hypothetical protein M426DRAFT_262281 [Hypoxylon sp. CI-4A]